MIEATVSEFFLDRPRVIIDENWQPRDEAYMTHTHAMDPAAANLGKAAAP
jgi:hypothetical protein